MDFIHETVGHGNAFWVGLFVGVSIGIVYCGAIVNHAGGALTMLFVADHTIAQGKEGEVASETGIATGVNFGTLLAHKDTACTDGGAIGAFYTTVFGVRIAAIATAALAFFVCHALNLLNCVDMDVG
jgi:hypothetical protein